VRLGETHICEETVAIIGPVFQHSDGLLLNFHRGETAVSILAWRQVFQPRIAVADRNP
jgi:hypothetical protein